MNPVPNAIKPRRHVWRWVFLGLGLCLAPFVALAIVAASFLTLESDAAALRKHVMAATNTGWHTKVQVDIGGLTIAAVRTGLAFVHKEEMAEAKQALAAVRHASVGVYERDSGTATWSREQLFAGTDRAMQKRGWTRLVGVADDKDTVLIYISPEASADKPINLCLAVVNGRELVVVSTSIDAGPLADLVQKYAGEDLKGRLRFAKLHL